MEARTAFRAAIHANPRYASAYNNLGNVLKNAADEAAQRAAGRAYTTAIRLSPLYVEAYRNLGNLLKEREAWRPSAVRAYKTVLALQPSDRVAFLNLGEVLQWLQRPDASAVAHALAVERGVWAHPLQRPSHYWPGLRAMPWWSVKDVPAARRLLSPATLSTLRRDGLALLAGAAGGAPTRTPASSFQPYHSPALSSGNWSDVTLAMAGVRQPGASLAPSSFEAWADLGEDTTTMVSGSAYFSILTPGARLRPHCGPTNIRLRVHLGISVPRGAGLRVGGEERTWRDGEALVFDDSFEHEVWNEGDEPRLVFIFDVWHPDLATDKHRLAALDPSVRAKYETAAAAVRSNAGLPEAPDLIAERRQRTIY